MFRATAMGSCWQANTIPTASEPRRDIVQFSGSNPPQLHLTPLESLEQHHQQLELAAPPPRCVPRDLLQFLIWAWTESLRSVFLWELKAGSPTSVALPSGWRDRLHPQLWFVSKSVGPSQGYHCCLSPQTTVHTWSLHGHHHSPAGYRVQPGLYSGKDDH